VSSFSAAGIRKRRRTHLDFQKQRTPLRDEQNVVAGGEAGKEQGSTRFEYTTPHAGSSLHIQGALTMANFCVKCGASLSGHFCVKCGADMSNAGTAPPPLPSSPVSQTPQPAVVPTSTAPAPAKQGMSALAKLGIAAVAIIFVGGAAGAVGVYYVAHRVSQKIHQAADGVLGSSSDTGASTSERVDSGSAGSSSRSSGSDSGSMGDVCRFLSKEDVSSAVGVEIVRTRSEDNGCTYIAKGTQADMTAKHVTAMMAARGADKKTQQMIQTFAGGMGKMFESEKPQSAQDTSGEVPVFNFSVDQQSADEQMRANAKALATLGDTQGLPGIGDQAFVSADGIIMVRKGKNLIRIMYITCPCGTKEVIPLAKQLAASL
jgi:hypothetical protein